ncbi:MAG: efflux RND transporter periplasmic adaptor subunit [Nitrospirae bacterium]|nr:efflux RND transporter periplasmic adaptor subunit [Nitrospirota bacterium]MBF0534510.1 efflux RND transporter periplasmic adaptor subunit [Nitrospirota bacterium]MBF0617136.1 efflux RND transporter periplasmic adaptor subunit [Nitrospirota bacterium]
MKKNLILSIFLILELFLPITLSAADNQTAADTDESTIEITDSQRQLIGVKVVEAKKKQFTKTIRTVGTMEYDQQRLATVNTKTEGWIEKLYVDYTGRYVKKGEPMAEIYSPELVATQQEFLNLLRWAKNTHGSNNTTNSTQSSYSDMLAKDTDSIVAAAKMRLKFWDITDAQIKKLQEKGQVTKTVTIFSPVSGFVTEKRVVQGMKVMPGEKFFDVADLSTLWLIADIYENELPFIKAGQTADITMSSFPGKVIKSKLDYIYPGISADTRTAKVRFVIKNPDGLLKPQMYAGVELAINLGERLSVPEDAVLDTGKRQVVFVDKGEGNYAPRIVKVGIKADAMVEITAGLKLGDRVASGAAFLIDSEAQLKGVGK